MEKLCLGQRKFSPLATVSEDFLRKHPNPHINLSVELARSPNALYVPRIPIYNEYIEEMNVACDRIFNLLATPEEALQDVQRRVQWKFDRVLRRWDLIKEDRLQEWNKEL